MFRTSIDLATKDLLPPNDEELLDDRARRFLAPRLRWLFENGRLPSDLRELSSCIRDDGNDAAHRANIGQEEANDLLDFTAILFERIFTIPKRVEIARERRNERREAGENL